MSVRNNFDAWALACWVITIVTLLAVLCGCGQHDYETSLGIRVTVEPGAGDPGPEYVDRAWQMVDSALGLHGGEDAEPFRVHFVADLGRCGDAETAGGCYTPAAILARVQRTSDRPCTGDALLHELVHYWEHLTARPTDHGHTHWQFTDALPAMEATFYVGCDEGFWR